MKETELGAYIVEWLEDNDWDVYQEVRPKTGGMSGPCCDIVAKKNGKVWAIECKTGLGFPVLIQAHHWRADYRSVAVPIKHRRKVPHEVALCARDHFKCGILLLRSNRDGDHTVQIRVPAPLMTYDKPYDKTLRTRLLNTLKPEHKTMAKAGTAKGGMWTPYRATMNRVQAFVKDNPGCTVREAVESLNGEWHYRTKSPASAASSIRRMLVEVETRKWCIVGATYPMTLYHWGAHSELRSGD